ncbi:hypothetical protein Gohar_022588 [Gossypium harknessii]|uniref:AB hydrolase-1 domain-containing protein n=1 Tax=Gossypium harknessii TaxID=34285 RepID=A0A7J9HA66_9ROSI|nr:hypothetical protein [Gossypium harknessii]
MSMLQTSLKAAMNARVIGSGSETMILAHGFGGDQSLWDKILPYLTKHYHVLLFDWLCSGTVKDPNLYDPLKYASFDAFADDLIALMDELHLTSSVLVGHSMSGMIGCIASIKKPQLFSRLIFVGSSPSIESDYGNWTSSFAKLLVDNNDPLSIEHYFKCLKSMNPEFVLPLAKAIFRSDERETLEKVTTPCTIVQVKNDLVVPNSVAYYMQKKIKGETTVEFVNADRHYPQLTAPLELIHVLSRVLGFEI